MFSPEPRFITPLDPRARSEGHEIGRLAAVLGKPLMPWQQMVATGATELTPDGLYKYSRVLITVPRQSGKTTLVGPVQLHRIMTRPGIKAFFTAQTGKDARARFTDLGKLVSQSPLSPLFKIRRAQGTEAISLANDSSVNLFAPTPSAMHGETPHLVTLDEIWKHDMARGMELMGAIGPAQSTLDGHAQIWMISTMGTAESGFMNDLVERGRAGEADLFYAEWSMPDGADPYDPKTWWSFHPALGNTVTQTALEKEAVKQSRGEWLRAYMNRLTVALDPIISAEDWDALESEPAEVPSRRDLSIGYAVALDDECAAVMAGWRDSTGAPCTRVIHTAPGTTWLVPFLLDLCQVWKPAHLAADDGGPNRRITDILRRAREAGDLSLDVYTTGAKDFATACETWLSYAKSEKTLRHDGSRILATGVASLATRAMGDATVFSRSRSAGPIVGPEASAIALWALDHDTNALPAPALIFPGA